jgi:hypothetical protein
VNHAGLDSYQFHWNLPSAYGITLQNLCGLLKFCLTTKTQRHEGFPMGQSTLLSLCLGVFVVKRLVAVTLRYDISATVR